MNRRLALQQLAIITGGMAFIPACSFDSDKVSVALDHLKIKTSHEKMLAKIVDTIIPKTSNQTSEIPGANDLNVHQFVLVMIDDCQDKPDQDAFVKGLYQFEDFVEDKYDVSFLKSDQLKRETILADIMKDEAGPEAKQDNTKKPPKHDLSAIKAFLSFTKGYTIKGYMVSQYVLTDIFPYQLVPGHFEGCAAVLQVKIQ